jgi:hypothetical protein
VRRNGRYRGAKYGDEAMKLLVGTLALVALTCAATAANAQMSPQQSQMNNNANIGRHASDANKGAGDEAKVKANDKLYGQALRNMPDKQYDPWHGVR